MRSGYQFTSSMKGEDKPLHPIWTGIGCILFVVLLVIGYLIGGWFVDANAEAHWMVIPPEFAWPPQSPYLLFKGALAFMVLLLGSALITVIYGILKPRKPGKFDVSDPSIFPPPPKRKR